MSDVIRIAVFYDGNYFAQVSNFYKYGHSRKARINVKGLHQFLQHTASEKERVDIAKCRVVEAHYFRGRFSANQIDQNSPDQAASYGTLRNDRAFDEVLTYANVTTHYTRMNVNDTQVKEQGIDVWLALEAYDMAVHKKSDILALVACDGDFVPLVRKLNSIGTRVMLLQWDFVLNGRETRVAQSLIEEVSYPVDMISVIDDRARRSDVLVNNLFVN